MMKDLRRNIDDYVALNKEFSKPLSLKVEKELFRAVKYGSSTQNYKILINPEKEYLFRLSPGEVIINYSEPQFNQGIKKQIEDSKSLLIPVKYNSKNIKQKRIIAPSIEYTLEDVQGGPTKRIDILKPKTLYLTFRNDEARDAREKIIQSHLRFVASVASKYPCIKYDLEDLISEGNIGLLNAINRFDVEKGFKFLTHARYSITQAIRSYIAKNSSKEFKTNSDIYERTSYIARVEDNLINKNQRTPTPEEILSEIIKRKIKGIGISRPINKRIIQDYQRNRDLSFTSVLGEDTLFEVQTIHKGFEEVERQDFMDYILNQCSAEERNLLARRYGLEDYDEESVRQLGKSLGFCPERARQKVQEVLDKLVI